MSSKRKKLDISPEGLEELLNLGLEGCSEDIEEADQNVGFYKTEILNTPLAKEQYGHLLNDALRIKGSARDRLIKMINLINNRVRTVEVMKQAQNGEDVAPEKMLAAIEKKMRELEDEDGE
jgi:hypothetical protein